MKTSLCLILCLFSPFLFAQHTPTQWYPRGVGGGGALFSPVISPHNGNEIWASCDMSPMHQSTNFGVSWSTIPFQELTGQKFSLVQFTSNPNKLYTLKLHPNGQYFPVVSLDAGKTWFNLPNPCTITAYRMFANPHDTGQYVVSDKNMVYYTKDDGSSAYVQVYGVPPSGDAYVAGAFFPSKDTIFVCVDKGIMYSTNRGVTWSNFTGISGIPSSEEIVGFSGARQGGRFVFFAATLSANKVQPKSYGEDVGAFQNLYRLSWGDNAWTSITKSLPSPASDKVYYIAMNPRDTNIVYLGGRANVGGNLGTVFKSSNSGTSFTNVFLKPAVLVNNGSIGAGWRGTSSLAAWDHKWNGLTYPDGIAVDPNNVNRLVFVDGLTMHTSIDGANSWRQAYTDTAFDFGTSTTIDPTTQFRSSGLGVTTAYWLTWIDSARIFAGFNDLLAMRTVDGGLKWSFDFTGLDSSRINDINMFIRHPSTGILYAAAGEVPGSNGDFTDARVAIVPGRISMSTDHGLTWQTMKSFGHAVTSIALDPTNQKRMYASVVDIKGGGGGIYVCQDISAGASAVWSTVPSNIPPRTEGRIIRIQVLRNGELLAVSAARDTSGSATPSFVYTKSSGIFYSANGGATWFDRSDAATMSWGTVNVEVDPNDKSDSTWFAFVSNKGVNVQGMYRSTDRGNTWVKLYGQAAYSCTFHPGKAHEMYLCTERNGLIYVTATDSTTPIFTPQDAYPFRYPQRVFFNPYDDNEVWVMSYGNEMHIGTTPVVYGLEKANQKRIYPIQVSPNPNHGTFTLGLPHDVNGAGMVTVINTFGQICYQQKIQIVDHVSVNQPQLSSGFYIVHLNIGRDTYVAKMLVD